MYSNSYFLRIYPLCIALAAVIFSIVCSFSEGILSTYDSGVYALGAKTISCEGLYEDFYGNKNSLTPPMYSLILSIAYRCGFPILVFSKTINVLCYGILIYSIINYVIEQNIFHKVSIYIFFGFSVLFSVNVFMVSNFLWSESVFVIITYFAIHQLQLYINEPYKIIHAFVAIILFCLGYLTRNLGIIGIVLFIGVLIYLKFVKKEHIKGVWLILVFFLGLTFWIWPLWQTTQSHQTIYEFPQNYNCFKSYLYLNAHIWDDFAPFSKNIFTSFLAILIPIILSFFLIVYRKINIWYVYALTYILFLGLLFSFFKPYEEDDVHRYIMPTTFIILVLFYKFIDWLILRFPLKSFFMLMIVLMVAYQGIRYYINFERWYNYQSLKPSKTSDLGTVIINKKTYKVSSQPEVDNLHYSEIIYKK